MKTISPTLAMDVPLSEVSVWGSKSGRVELQLPRLDVSGLDDDSSDDEKENSPKLRLPLTVYKEYTTASKDLEKKLGDFAHDVQKLGSTLALSTASRELKSRLSEVRHHFEHISNNATRKGKKRRKTRQKDFQDYDNRDGTKTLAKFIQQIAILNECLSFFGSNCDSEILQGFVERKITQMKAHLSETMSVLDRFREVGIPCLSEAQKRSTRMLLNAATIVTLFAGVSASTLQFSSSSNDTHPMVAANSLWFASLVLSIGAAINALLAMTWRQAIFSSPTQRLPYYLQFWMRQGYLFLLIIAVVTFIGGLLCYVFAKQRMVAFWISVGCTILIALGLTSVSVWLCVDRINFTKLRRNTHEDVGLVTNSSSQNTSPPHHLRAFISKRNADDALEGNGNSSSISMFSSTTDKTMNRRSQVTEQSETPTSPTGWFQANFGRKQTLAHQAAVQDSLAAHLSEDEPTPLPITRVDTAVQEKDSEEQMRFISCANDLQAKVLKPPGSARWPVKHLQLSPCGDWLVVCWYRTSTLYKYEGSEEFKFRHDIVGPKTHAQKQSKMVKWCPRGKRVLIMLSYGVTVWDLTTDTEELQYRHLVHAQQKPKWLEWLNEEEFLILWKDGTMSKMSLQEKKVEVTNRWTIPNGRDVRSFCSADKENTILLLATHSFENAAIDYIIVLDVSTAAESNGIKNPGSHCQLATGALGDGHPAVVPKGGNIITEAQHGFSGCFGQILQKIPLKYDAQSLSVASDREHVAVGYEQEAPELWFYNSKHRRLQFLRGMGDFYGSQPSSTDNESHRAWQWGLASLLGPSDSIVACPDDDAIHLWNRHNGKHLEYALRVVNEDIEGPLEMMQYSWVNSENGIAPKMVVSVCGGKSSQVWVWKPQPSDGPGRALPQSHGIGVHVNVISAQTDAAPSNVNVSSENAAISSW